MTAARIAAVFEELAALDLRRAELQRELAALLGGGAPNIESQSSTIVNAAVIVSTPSRSKPSSPKTPRRGRARPAVVVPQDVSELDVRRATELARRRGIVVG